MILISGSYEIWKLKFPSEGLVQHHLYDPCVQYSKVYKGLINKRILTLSPSLEFKNFEVTDATIPLT